MRWPLAAVCVWAIRSRRRREATRWWVGALVDGDEALLAGWRRPTVRGQRPSIDATRGGHASSIPYVPQSNRPSAAHHAFHPKRDTSSIASSHRSSSDDEERCPPALRAFFLPTEPRGQQQRSFRKHVNSISTFGAMAQCPKTQYRPEIQYHTHTHRVERIDGAARGLPAGVRARLIEASSAFTFDWYP